jgi:hypothetical protein
VALDLAGLFLSRSTFGGICPILTPPSSQTLREDFTRKSEYSYFTLAPCLTRQSRLAASLFEELFAIEAMFRCNLGEQDPALRLVNDEQTMTSDLNLFRLDWRRRRKNRNFNVELLEFFQTQGRKPRIAKGRTGGTPPNALPKGLFAFNDSDAAAQASADVQCYKNAAPLAENSMFGDIRRKLRPGDGFDNRLARPLQQRSAVFFRGEQHPGISCGSRAY